MTLRFDTEETEAAWRDYDNRTALPRLRFTLGLAFALYAAFGWLDLAVAPEAVGRLWAIRGVVCAGILGVLAGTWSTGFGRVRQVLLAGIILLTAGGIIGMLAITERGVETLYYVGLILVLMATHAFGWVCFPIAVAMSVVVVLGYDVELLWSRNVEPVIALNNNFFFLSATILGMVASYSGERHARLSFLHARIAEVERARSDRLLLNVLPSPIAERLKSGAAGIADGFPEVSVLFADLVDFSAMSQRFSPEALVQNLDEIFSEFDRIVGRFEIEKIKTMGDAYMAVSGLPVPRSDHAERMAEAALAILERSIRLREEGRPWCQIRIGLAIGPVVAGVIGTTKFIYDLWGEPVTMASRMQLLGVPDRIQATERFRRRLAHAYEFEYRGEIEVKGRGPTVTWWLVGRKSGVVARELGGQIGDQSGSTLSERAEVH